MSPASAPARGRKPPAKKSARARKPPAKTGEVRYRDGGTGNGILLQVIHEKWGYICYWCGPEEVKKNKRYSEVELDHIVPRTIDDADLQQLIHDRELPADFDVDRPYNLAPICRPCNREKSDENFLNNGKVYAKLRRAQRYEPEVIKGVQNFTASNKMAKSLVYVTRADLSDPGIREAFEQHAPAVVQDLASHATNRLGSSANRDS